MELHNYCPFIFVVFISILPFIYTQNALEDHVNVPNVARKEVGFYTNSRVLNAPDDEIVDDGNATSKQEDFEKAHNAIRKEHGLGPVTWNATIAKYAQDFADKRKADCALEHSMGDQGYAENVAIGGTAEDVVKMWAAEKADYDPVSKKCAPGKMCGHYLQVVAKEGIQIGCGRVKCTNNKVYYFVICDYWQPPSS